MYMSIICLLYNVEYVSYLVQVKLNIYKNCYLQKKKKVAEWSSPNVQSAWNLFWHWPSGLTVAPLRHVTRTLQSGSCKITLQKGSLEIYMRKFDFQKKIICPPWWHILWRMTRIIFFVRRMKRSLLVMRWNLKGHAHKKMELKKDSYIGLYGTLHEPLSFVRYVLVKYCICCFLSNWKAAERSFLKLGCAWTLSYQSCWWFKLHFLEEYSSHHWTFFLMCESEFTDSPH